MNAEPLVVLITFPSQEVAERIARAAVERGLVACVNLVPGVRSIYAWEGEIHADDEVLGVAKTTAERLDELTSFVRAEHPYDTPEVVSLAPAAVEERYLAWLVGAVGRGQP